LAGLSGQSVFRAVAHDELTIVDDPAAVRASLSNL
jgi:hypothetical protein